MQLIGVLITLLVISLASVFLYTHFSSPGEVTNQNANQVVDRATDDAIVGDIANIKTQIELYKAQKGSYPNSLQDLVTEHLLTSVPINPKTHETYIYSTDGITFQLAASSK